MKTLRKVRLNAMLLHVRAPITLRFYARLLSSIIYALISIRASVISRGYQSTQLINCSHARTRGFMVQKCKVMVARECFCVSFMKIHASLRGISQFVYNSVNSLFNL